MAVNRITVRGKLSNMRVEQLPDAIVGNKQPLHEIKIKSQNHEKVENIR